MTGRRHLVLVGLMGAGKTSVGSLCAQRLSRPFVDTDALVVTLAGVPFDEIFAAGEPHFRELECRAVADACASPEAAVIACGGGAVLDAGNRRRLRAAGVVVWLRARPEELARRVGDDGGGRPLLAGGPAATLVRLAVARAPSYEAVADLAVDTDGRSVPEVATAVIQAYQA
jgi:shikimate kinase